MESRWQERELRRDQIIKEAVRTADMVLLSGADGSEEELNYLTAKVASKMLERALYPFQSKIMRHDFEKEGMIHIIK